MGFENAESHSDTTHKPDCPKAGGGKRPGVCHAWKRGQHHAGVLDAVDRAACDPVTSALRDVLMKANQVGFARNTMNPTTFFSVASVR
jgi:hypothetical protein